MAATILEAVLARAARSLKRPALLLAVRRRSDGSFDTEFAIDGLLVGEVEAAALDLLRIIVGDIAPDTACPCCRLRRERVATAVAALEARPVPGTTH